MPGSFSAKELERAFKARTLAFAGERGLGEDLFIGMHSV